MSELIDLVGKKFGLLTVISLSSKRTKSGQLLWVCQCMCGESTVVAGYHLRYNHTKSCGCLVYESRNLKHGNARNRQGLTSSEYYTWCAMKGRCLNQKNKDYRLYGGRGIRICERWLTSFDNFLADMGRRPSPQHTIDRIDNDGNYEPDNCRWATPLEQRHNQRRTQQISAPLP